jgi:hypothetical protein
MLDLALRNAHVVDGTGGPSFTASIGVKDGKIAEVGDDVGAAHREIEANGRLVTPGFVDIHTHYDGQVCWDKQLSPSQPGKALDPEGTWLRCDDRARESDLRERRGNGRHAGKAVARRPGCRRPQLTVCLWVGFVACAMPVRHPDGVLGLPVCAVPTWPQLA